MNPSINSRSPSPRTRWGWIVTGIGFIVLLWGVFYLTSATVGGRVHDFSERRTYNEVKVAAHQAYPGALVRGLAGLALMWLGGWIRGRARADA